MVRLRLLELLAEGEPMTTAEQEALYLAIRAKLLPWITRRFSEDAAEDILHVAFLKLIDVEGVAHPVTYAGKIALNLHRDQFRRRREFVDLSAVDIGTDSHERTALAHQILALAEKHVSLRDLAELRQSLDGMSDPEIGRRNNRKPVSIRGARLRTIRLLRELAGVSR